MAGVRAIQKEKTRRALVNAAFKSLVKRVLRQLHFIVILVTWMN